VYSPRIQGIIVILSKRYIQEYKSSKGLQVSRNDTGVQ
jgi:hypothetical protein